jgi:5-methylcytosine-specific restriction endonuclease McrA
VRYLTETQRQYQDYLQSPAWQRRRLRILERADEHCEACGRFAGKNPHGNHLERELKWCGNPACRFCRFYFDAEGQRSDGELQVLEVHHRTYERRGNERDSDLAALCWGCHEETWDTDRAPNDYLLEMIR